MDYLIMSKFLPCLPTSPPPLPVNKYVFLFSFRIDDGFYELILLLAITINSGYIFLWRRKISILQGVIPPPPGLNLVNIS